MIACATTVLGELRDVDLQKQLAAHTARPVMYKTSHDYFTAFFRTYDTYFTFEEQEALQTQRDRATLHNHEKSHLKRLAIGE